MAVIHQGYGVSREENCPSSCSLSRIHRDVGQGRYFAFAITGQNCATNGVHNLFSTLSRSSVHQVVIASNLQRLMNTQVRQSTPKYA